MEELLTEAALAGLVADLVRVPSVNPALVPEEGTGEAAIAELARGWLLAHGVEAWLEPVVTGRPNLVAETGHGERTLILCAHLDTVGTAGMVAPFAPDLRDGRLYGRGAYDMKGSAGAVLAAVFAASGIPTVDVGPAGAGAHEAVEWVDLKSVTATARILVAAAERFLGTA